MERLAPASVIQQVQDAFDTWAQEGHGERMERGHWPTSGQIMANLGLEPGHRFLDVGCGNGYTVSWAATRVGDTGQAIGIDLAPEMIAQAHAQHGRPNTQFLVAEATHLPFAGATFDRLVNIESLYYYPDIPCALAEFHRVLKPGGWLALMVDFYRENPYSAVWADLMPIPMTNLSEADYHALLTQAGFTAVRTERLFNPEPVDTASFKPGWGYNSPEDVRRFRQEVGSLAIWGQKPLV